MLRIKAQVLGPIQTNCYTVYDEVTREAAVINPAFYGERIYEQLLELKVTLKYIIFTHAHFDHLMGADFLIKNTGAETVAYVDEVPRFADVNKCGAGFISQNQLKKVDIDIAVNEQSKLFIGETEITFMHTPGHTPGSMCIFMGEHMFSGDTLFYLSVGRWDLVGGDLTALRQSIKKLNNLTGDYKVYPGHNEWTTLQYERENNDFFE